MFKTASQCVHVLTLAKINVLYCLSFFLQFHLELPSTYILHYSDVFEYINIQCLHCCSQDCARGDHSTGACSSWREGGGRPHLLCPADHAEGYGSPSEFSSFLWPVFCLLLVKGFLLCNVFPWFHFSPPAGIQLGLEKQREPGHRLQISLLPL